MLHLVVCLVNFNIIVMCGYTHGHYQIHLRVWELAVAPSPINHMALRDHFFLSLVLCEPHKAKPFRVASLGISFNLGEKHSLSTENL